jgi:uncharacterized protein (UPF0332 family)
LYSKSSALRLERDEAVEQRALYRQCNRSAFLGRAYNLKAIADYETGPGSVVTPERVEAALSTAIHFVDVVTELLNDTDASP